MVLSDLTIIAAHRVSSCCFLLAFPAVCTGCGLLLSSGRPAHALRLKPPGSCHLSAGLAAAVMDLAAGSLLGNAHPAGQPAALAHDVSEPYNRGLQLLRQAAATVQRRVPEDTDGDEVMEDTDISQLTQAERDQLLSAASKGQDCKKLRR